MRGTWVFRDGKCIPKSEALRDDYMKIAKNVSELPRPYIQGDLPEYRSMIDGSVVSGRKQHRDHLKAYGCIEVGNEQVNNRPAKVDRSEVRGDIKTALEQLESGYTPPPDIVGTKTEEGVTIEAPEVEPIVIDKVPENGAYVRSSTTE